MNAFTELLDWLWVHAPGLLVLVLIVAGCIWLTVNVNDFGNRLGATELLCNELNDRQKEMSREMNARFSKIELSLNTIITYLPTKSGKFHFEENKNV